MPFLTLLIAAAGFVGPVDGQPAPHPGSLDSLLRDVQTRPKDGLAWTELGYTVSYDRKGDSTSEPIYFELDPKELDEGFKEIEVRLTDLNADRQVVKSAVFSIEEEPRLREEHREPRGLRR